LVVRVASVKDAVAILEIERSSAAAPHWCEGIWAQILSEHAMHGPQRMCFVAEHTHEVVGFLVLGIAPGIAELESIAVLKSARRHGVGRSLCLQAAFLAQTTGAELLQLEVRSANEAALALYRSLGFAEQGRRSGYYSDPKDDAVLMALPLASKDE
jgi:ribosomal-protein-alanine N-acetyltransferase